MDNSFYFMFARDFFEGLSYNLVKNYGREDNYLVKVEDQKVKSEVFADVYDMDIIDQKVEEIIRKIFEEDECKVNIIVDNEDEKTNRVYISIGEVEDEQNTKVYSKIILNDKKILNGINKKKIIKELKDSNLYKCETYSNEELLYQSEKYKKDKMKCIELTKDLYIPLDTPEEITVFYHNYRIIKMKKIQVKYAKYVIDKINNLLEEIYDKQNIIKYNGIELEYLDKLEEELFNHKISMMDINKKIMLA